MVQTLYKPFSKSYDNSIIWLPYFLFFILDIISRGEMWVDISFVRNKFYLFDDHSAFLTFWIEYYAIYLVWSFVALVVMVPVMSKVITRQGEKLDVRGQKAI